MAATGPPTTAPLPPTTYHEHYTQSPDVLSANYDALYALHHPTTGQATNVIFDNVVDATDNIPTVFLSLVSSAPGTFNVIALHNPWRYKPSMVAGTSTWDGQVFAFHGDISVSSRFIRTVSLPDDIFDTVTEQRV